MSAEEPTRAHTPGSSEADGGREGPVETEGADAKGSGHPGSGVNYSPVEADARTGQTSPTKLGAWARRWLVPGTYGTPGEPNGPATVGGTVGGSVAPRWPGGRQPDPDGSSESGEEPPRHAVDHAAVDAAAAEDASSVREQPETFVSDLDAAVAESTSPLPTSELPATTGQALPLPEPPPLSTEEIPPPAHVPVTPRTTPATKPRKKKRRRSRSKGRVVSERLRHIGPWSVLKVAGLFYVCLVLTVLTASVALWQLGRSTETVDQMESFVSRLFSYGDCIPRDEVEPGTSFQLDDDCPEGTVLVGGFEVDDPTLLRSALIGGGIFVGAATLGTVLLAVLFNLLSDVTGGVRYTVVRGSVGTAAGSTRRGPQH